MANEMLNNGRFLRINEVFAFVGIYPDGSEDIIALQTPREGCFPLVGADFKLIDPIMAILKDKIPQKRYEIRVYSITGGQGYQEKT